MKGFREFVLRGNLIELAVAVVIGTAFVALVKGFADSFITPLIALLGGKPNFNSLSFVVNKTTFTYGTFLSAIFSFVITAAIVYFLVVVPAAKLLARMSRNKEATERECPECSSEIPVTARRCKFCTSVVAPVAT